MQKRIAAGLLALTLGLAGLTGRAAQPTQPTTDKSLPKLIYGHDLPVRLAGTVDVTPKTPRFGVDVFQDETTQATIAISHTGALTVTESEPIGTDKGRGWIAAYDLPVRKAGEAEITQKTKKWGVELFRFPGSNRLIYASESGALAFTKIPPGLARDKGWKRSHGLDLKVREPGADSFNNAKRIGVEVYHDQNTNGLLYVSENGSVAAIPGTPLAADKKTLPPTALYGLELRVRKADEKEFSEKTKQVPVEVFEDPNTGVLIYVSETGFVATAPNKKLAEKPSPPSLVKGINLKVRKAGEQDIEKAAKFGIEVFTDHRTGYLVFISETGSIAVLSK